MCAEIDLKVQLVNDLKKSDTRKNFCAYICISRTQVALLFSLI